MVSILIYVLLGILIYVAGIPILEELATVIVQGLEVFKGLLVVSLAKLQDEADAIKEKTEPKTRAIGFTLPEDDDEYEEEEYD